MVSVINTVAIEIFARITYFEAHHSVSDETFSSFSRITIMQFINICVIIMLVNFNLDGLEGTYEKDDESFFWKHVGIFDGAYADFSVQWYFNIGASVCLTMCISIISPHISYLAIPIMTSCSRCCDRGCNCNIEKSPGVAPGKCDDVNTSLLLQSELQDFYTNGEIASYYVYAQIFTTLWSCLCFSSGLPIMYPVAFVSYAVLYWVYKCLLVKYYSKTTQFDEDLPLRSIDYMKYGIVFHMAVGAFMFTNSAVLASSEDIDQLTMYTDMLSENENYKWFQERFLLSAHAQIYLAVIVIGVVFACLWGVLKVLFENLAAVLSCSCCRAAAMELETRASSYN
jgi:hypothetical protein